jgi:hypothetical protein
LREKWLAPKRNLRLDEGMAYRWNELDPQSSGFLKMLCMWLFSGVSAWYFRHEHPVLALTGGLIVGTLVAQIIPPRWSCKRVFLVVAAWLIVGTIYAFSLAKMK